MSQVQSPGHVAVDVVYSTPPNPVGFPSQQHTRRASSLELGNNMVQAMYRTILDESREGTPLAQDSHIDSVRHALLDLTNSEMAQLLFKDELLSMVMLVVTTATFICDKGKDEADRPPPEVGHNFATRVLIRDAPHENNLEEGQSSDRNTAHGAPKGGRLPPLAFAKYTLGEDFCAYISNFQAIARAC
jgi:hypothetical protein